MSILRVGNFVAMMTGRAELCADKVQSALGVDGRDAFTCRIAPVSARTLAEDVAGDWAPLLNKAA